MPSSDFSESTVLAEWASRECTHLDLIASWETLMAAYEVLGFTGPDSDEERLSEFKTIIGELNKFLTRMRRGLESAKSVEDAIEFLVGHANTTDTHTIKTRPSIAYNKLKQQWIRQSVSVLEGAVSMVREGERDE